MEQFAERIEAAGKISCDIRSNELRVVIFLLVIILFGCESVCPGAIHYYVSTRGHDSNPGTREKPFATLEAARDAVRKSKTRGEGVDIYLRGGFYRRSFTFELNEKDSGTKEHPIVYKAYPGENVRITGGVEYSAALLSPVTDRKILDALILPQARNKIMKLDLKKIGITDYGRMRHRGFCRSYANAPMELFFNDKPMKLSKWPDKGFVKIKKIIDRGSRPRYGDYGNRGGRFVYDSERPARWKLSDDIWIHGMFGKVWADDTLQVLTIDTDKKEITTTHPHLYGIFGGHFYALNVLEEIAEPGEYYIDRKNGMLYFWPPGDIKDGVISFSMLEEPVIAMEGCRNVTFENVIIECTRGLGVYIERGENNKMAGCTFRNIGLVAASIGKGIEPFDSLRHSGTGKPVSRILGNVREHFYDNVDLDRDAGRNNGLLSCDIYNTGAGGVSLGGGNRRKLVSAGNYVINCDIHSFNRLDRTYRPGVDITGCGNIVSHNLIYNGTHSAIIFYGNEHLMAYNKIYDVLLESDDGGAFYTGRDPSGYGCVIENNIVYRAGSTNPLYHLGYWAAVYLDDFCGGITIKDNIFKDTKTGVLASGRDIHVDNNILINCERAIVFQARSVKAIQANRIKQFHVNQPPWSEKYPSLVNALEQDWGKFVGSGAANNVSWPTKCVIVDRVDKRFLTLQDNLTVDEYPGFRNIPTEKIGLYVDEYRKKLPAQFDFNKSSR